MFNKRNNGFTLVELIVVIAIIGILVAIAIPSMGNVLDKTREKRDMAQAKLVRDTLQVALYSGDMSVKKKNNGEYRFYFPSTGNTINGTGQTFEKNMKALGYFDTWISSNHGASYDDRSQNRYRIDIDPSTHMCTISRYAYDEDNNSSIDKVFYTFPLSDEYFE